MIRDMKWHIFNPDGEPLCWDDKVLEFDTQMAAKEFLTSVIKNSECNEDSWAKVEIREGILYYDGGYINATNLLVARNDILVPK